MNLAEDILETEPFLRVNYRSQLYAIRTLLDRQRRVDADAQQTIEETAEFARNGTEQIHWFVLDRWTDLVIDSFFQDAAHSMAAVGMLAPITESAFTDAFRKIGRTVPLPHDETGGLVPDIMKSAREVGMIDYLPDGLMATLQALFEYRNKMFHCGFEWPLSETKKFEQRTKVWPPGWFVMASHSSQPWMFWMSPAFIEHCLHIIEAVINGLGDFLVDQIRARVGQPPLGLQQHRTITNFLGLVGNELLET